MIKQLIADIIDAVSESIDEPAGRGCGYGITEDGMDEIERVIRDFFEKEHDMQTFDYQVNKTDDNGAAISVVKRGHGVLAKNKEAAERIALAEANKESGDLDQNNLEVLVRPFCRK